MKKIIFILAISMISMISCVEESDVVKTPDNYFHNEKFKIVSSNECVNGDYSQPLELKRWLIQRLKDTTYYAELSSLSRSFAISKEMWYSKGVSDTLYFEFIGKWRFFIIGEPT